MTDTAAVQPQAIDGKGLAARLAGVVFSPRATYADVVARPRALGVLLVSLLVMASSSLVFLSTDVGKNAVLDQQERTMQNMGIRMNDAQYAQMQARMTSSIMPAISAVAQVVVIPIARFTIHQMRNKSIEPSKRARNEPSSRNGMKTARLVGLDNDCFA